MISHTQCNHGSQRNHRIILRNCHNLCGYIRKVTFSNRRNRSVNMHISVDSEWLIEYPEKGWIQPILLDSYYIYKAISDWHIAGIKFPCTTCLPFLECLALNGNKSNYQYHISLTVFSVIWKSRHEHCYQHHMRDYVFVCRSYEFTLAFQSSRRKNNGHLLRSIFPNGIRLSWLV